MTRLDYTLRPADLILVRGSSPLDRIIEGLTHSLYSHVAGIVKLNEVFEAELFQPDGYNALDFYRGASDIYTCDALTDDQRQRIVNRALEKMGHHYGYRLILWEGEHYLLHRDPSYNPAVDEPDCSQLWAEAYKEEGFDPDPAHKLLVFSPGDLAISPIFHCVGPLV